MIYVRYLIPIPYQQSFYHRYPHLFQKIENFEFLIFELILKFLRTVFNNAPLFTKISQALIFMKIVNVLFLSLIYFKN